MTDGERLRIADPAAAVSAQPFPRGRPETQFPLPHVPGTRLPFAAVVALAVLLGVGTALEPASVCGVVFLFTLAVPAIFVGGPRLRRLTRALLRPDPLPVVDGGPCLSSGPWSDPAHPAEFALLLWAAFAPLMLVTRGGPPAPVALAVVASLPLSVLAVVWVRRRRRAVQVRFERWPLRPGERVRVYVATVAGGGRLDDAGVLFRCVDTAPGWRWPWGVPDVVWARQVDLPADRAPGPDEFVEVDFRTLPADARATSPDGDRVHWELLVAGRTRWGAALARFRVPVAGDARRETAT